MVGVYDIIREHGRIQPDKLAVVTDELRLTYRQLNRRINCVAYGLQQAGIRKGQRVAMLMNNEADFITVFFALIKLGACVCPFNYKLMAREINALQEQVECKCLIAGNEFLETALNMQEASASASGLELIMIHGHEIYPSIEDYLINGRDDWDYSEPLEGEDIIYCLFTGGTTGLPKASMHSQYATFIQICGYLLDAPEGDANTVYLHYSPMFHMGGIGGLLRILSAGGTFCLIGSFSVEKIIEYIKKEHITELAAIPPTILNRFKEEQDLDLSSLKTLKIAGGLCTEDTFDLIFCLMPEVVCSTAYGSSENAAYMGKRFSREEFNNNRRIFHSVGKPMHFYEARIMRDCCTEAKANEHGELYGRSPAMMSGYLGSSPVLTRDGWYPTGDVLYRDEDGDYHFCSRVKDMIKSGGENIYAAEVENIIASNKKVSECAVIGLPDSEFGEIVAAVVVAKCAALTEKEVIDHCAGKIAGFKKPRKVFFAGELPLTGVGKVDKDALKEKIMEMMSGVN